MESRSIGLGMVSAGGEHTVPGRLMDVCMWWGCGSTCVWMELEELLNCVDLKLLNVLSWIFEQTVWLSRRLLCVPWMNRSAALTQSDQQEVTFNHTNGEQPVTGSTHWNCSEVSYSSSAKQLARCLWKSWAQSFFWLLDSVAAPPSSAAECFLGEFEIFWLQKLENSLRL